MIGLVYAEGSLLARRIAMDESEEALRLVLAVQPGEALILREKIPDGAPETLRAIIAEVTGVPVEEHFSGRCGVIDPKTRLAEAFILADPALDDYGHKELHPSDEADLNWKVDRSGEWLARFARSDGDGVVKEIVWAKPEADPPAGMLQVIDSAAAVGQKLPELEKVEVETEGTQRL